MTTRSASRGGTSECDNVEAISKVPKIAAFGTASDGFGMDRAGIDGSRSPSWVCSVCSINCWAAEQVLQTSCYVPTRDCELPPVCSEAPLPSTHVAGIACEALELRARMVQVGLAKAMRV